eukprot:5429584-Pyramimonas_sp.AAC.1
MPTDGVELELEDSMPTNRTRSSVRLVSIVRETTCQGESRIEWRRRNRRPLVAAVRWNRSNRSRAGSAR